MGREISASGLASVQRAFWRIAAVGFLLALTWKAISGALAQLPRARTSGQKVETALQLESGALGLLVAFSCARQGGWVEALRWAWGVTLAAAAGLSGLVWGPPMPLIGALFAAAGLLVSRLVARALGAAGGVAQSEPKRRTSGK